MQLQSGKDKKNGGLLTSRLSSSYSYKFIAILNRLPAYCSVFVAGKMIDVMPTPATSLDDPNLDFVSARLVTLAQGLNPELRFALLTRG